MSKIINVALATEGAVAVAASEFLGDAYYHRAGGRTKFVNDGVRMVPGDDTSVPTGAAVPDTDRWVPSVSKPHPQWVWIRFREPARISRVVVHRADIADYPVDFSGE